MYCAPAFMIYQHLIAKSMHTVHMYYVLKFHFTVSINFMFPFPQLHFAVSVEEFLLLLHKTGGASPRKHAHTLLLTTVCQLVALLEIDY